MRKYLYIRVSTKEQNEDRQLALKDKYGLRNSDVFIDKATGKNFDRPAYQNLKEELQKGDTLIVMSLDRLGRNKEQALEELRELKQKGVRLIVDDLPTTQIELDEKNQLIIEMINNILIEVYTTLAEEELKRTKIRQRQGIDSMPVNDNGKRYSKKTGREVGRPNKQKNLTTEQERYIKAWLSKSIKLSDCIKLSGLSRATLYRIKGSILSQNNVSKYEVKKRDGLFDTLDTDHIDKILEPDFYIPEMSELKKGDKLLEFKYKIINETPDKFEEDEELNEYSPFFFFFTVDKSFKNFCYIDGKKYDNIEDFIYFNDENYMKLLVFMERTLIYKFTTVTDDDKNLYLLKNKHKKIYKVLETYIKQLSFKEREGIYTKITYRLENYLVLDKKVVEKIKKVLKPIFLR